MIIEDIVTIKINDEIEYTVDCTDYTELEQMLEKYDENVNIKIMFSYISIIDHFSKFMKHSCTARQLMKMLNEYADKGQFIDEYYNDLDNKDEIYYLTEFYDFTNPEEFFNENFPSPYYAALAVRDSVIDWNDKYIRFDGYGYLETYNEIPYIDYYDEIIEQWLKENF